MGNLLEKLVLTGARKLALAGASMVLLASLNPNSINAENYNPVREHRRVERSLDEDVNFPEIDRSGLVKKVKIHGNCGVVTYRLPEYDQVPREVNYRKSREECLRTLDDPSAPANLTINYDDGWINLRWNSVPEADEYHIYSSVNPDTGFSFYTSVLPPDTSMSIPLSENMRFFNVRAVENLPDYYVTGNVFEILNEQNVDSAKVVIKDLSNNRIDSTYTDVNGDYFVGLNNPGDYLIQVEKPNEIYQWPMQDLIDNDRWQDTISVASGLEKNLDKIVEDLGADFKNFVREVCEWGDPEDNYLPDLPIQRWSHSSAVYFHPDYPAPDSNYYNEVVNVIENDLPLFTDNIITPYITTNPDSAEIYVRFRPVSYFPSGASGSHAELLINNEIILGAVNLGDWLTENQRRRISLNEFGQVLGARMDSNINPNSIFYDPIPNIAGYSQDDLNLGKVLYTYPIGQWF